MSAAATTKQQRLAAVFAKSSTSALIGGLRILEATPASPEHRMVRAWTIEELERRFPEAAASVEAAFEAAELELIEGRGNGDVDYVAVLVAAIPANQR